MEMLTQRVPGRVKFPNRIRQAILENGYTVEEVAEATGIPKRSLFDYCAGRTKVPRERIESIAKVIGCSPNLLLPTIYICGDTIQYEYGELDKQAVEGESNLDKLRRSILQLLLGTSITLPELQDTWERLAYALNNPYRIDEAALAKLEQLTDIYWELYRSAIAKIDLLSGLQGHLTTIAKLLQVSQPSAILGRLCEIASNTAQIIGEIYLDAGDVERATSYYHFAVEIAKEANNPTLQALALGRRAFVSMYLGEPQQALPLLQEAYREAEEHATGKTLAWIAMMEAEALSSLRSDETLPAIEKTEFVLTEKQFNGNDMHWTGFNSAALAAYKGACFLRMHQPEQARIFLQIALDGLPPGPTRREALILADISKSYIQQGEIEEACERTSQSLACAARAKSARALQEVRGIVKQQLNPWKKLPEVKRLDEQLKVVKLL